MSNMSNPFLPGTNDTPTTPAVPGGSAAPMPGAGASTDNMSFEVDLTDVQSGYTIPDGMYKVRCIGVEQSVSQSGNPMFTWQFVIVGGEYAGREFRMWTAITAAAMWKVAEAVTALGVGQTGQVVKFNKSDVLNRECGAVIEQQEYKGNTSSSIRRLVSLADYNSAVAGAAPASVLPG